MKEDILRSKETQTMVEKNKEEAKLAELDEIEKKKIDAAREEIRAVLDGKIKIEREEVQSLSDAFAEVQRGMKERFSSRLNTKEENEQLAILMQGKKIYETFEIAPNGFSIRFQSLTSDENTFAGQISLQNGAALRSGKETTPIHDESFRIELLLAFSTAAINDNTLTSINLSDFYEDTVDEDGVKKGPSRVSDKLKELQGRVGKIKQLLPMGVYSTVITALGVWLEFQQNLVSPEKIGNF